MVVVNKIKQYIATVLYIGLIHVNTQEIIGVHFLNLHQQQQQDGDDDNTVGILMSKTQHVGNITSFLTVFEHQTL